MSVHKLNCFTKAYLLRGPRHTDHVYQLEVVTYFLALELLEGPCTLTQQMLEYFASLISAKFTAISHPQRL
jgi:hypothetical protein